MRLKGLLLLLVGTLQITSVQGCDFCSCYIGVEPMYNSNSIQLRYRTSHYKGSHTSGFAYARHPEPTIENWSELYETISLIGVWYVKPKIRLDFRMNAARNRAFNESLMVNHLQGLGDMSVLVSYQVYHSPNDGRAFQHRLFGGLGIQIPTGGFQNTGMNNSIEPLFQSGTGAFGGITQLIYLMKWKQFGLTSNASYTFMEENPDYYLYAPRLNTTILFSYQLLGGDWMFVPNTGLYIELAGSDLYIDKPVENTGGNVTFWQSNIDISYRNFVLSVGLQIPAIEELKGSQGENLTRWNLGFKYVFTKKN